MLGYSKEYITNTIKIAEEDTTEFQTTPHFKVQDWRFRKGSKTGISQNMYPQNHEGKGFKNLCIINQLYLQIL